MKWTRRILNAVRSASGQPKPGRSIVPRKEDSVRDYPSAGLTPSRLAAIFKEADDGSLATAMELFEQMEEKDAHLFSIANTRRLALTGLDWQVMSAGEMQDGVDRNVAEEAAAYCREILSSVETFDEVLQHLSLAIGRNIAIAEIVWDFVDGELRPVDVAAVDFTRIVFDEGDRPRILTAEAPRDGVELAPNKFIVHTPHSVSGHPQRGGLLRVTAMVYLAKNLSLKDWMIFAEVFGMPVRIARYDATATDDEKRELLHMLESLGSNAAGIFSRAVELQIVEANRGTSGPPYERLVDFLNREMSKAWLGQTLTTDIAGQSGSVAASRVHDAPFAGIDRRTYYNRRPGSAAPSQRGNCEKARMKSAIRGIMHSDSFSIPVFTDDDEAVVASAKKRLVYLDSNLWIDIAERHQDVADQCRHAVCTGQATFPVSYSAVAEVIEQPDRTQRCRIASLMDELSKGISFRDRDDIAALEDGAALEVLLGRAATPIGREKVLCHLTERLGRAVLEFPPGWNEPDAQEFVELFARRPELRSVRWLVDHLDIEKMQANHAKSKRKYVDKMSEDISRSAAHFGNLPKQVRRKRLLLEERVGLFKRVIIPRQSRKILHELLRVFGPNMDAFEAFFKQVGEGSEERLEQGMRAMPSQDLLCHIMAEGTGNYARKVKEQDFHDVEHAIVPAVYADVFVTEDRHLFDLLTRRCNIPATRGCRIVRGVKGLREILRSLAASDM